MKLNSGMQHDLRMSCQNSLVVIYEYHTSCIVELSISQSHLKKKHSGARNYLMVVATCLCGDKDLVSDYIFRFGIGCQSYRQSWSESELILSNQCTLSMQQ